MRPPVAPLKVPPRPTRSASFSHSTFSPLPSSTPFSPSPTPKPRPRPPETPAWLLLLAFHTLPLYTATISASNSSPSTLLLTFLLLAATSAAFLLLQDRQARALIRTLSITPSHWCLLFTNAVLISTSVFLKLHSLRSSGPLSTLIGEYAGLVLGKLLLLETTTSVRGILVTILSTVLLSQGWSTESCSPLAIRRLPGEATRLGICPSVPVWSAVLAGLLSCVVRLVSTRTSLRVIPKKRVQGLSHVLATFLTLPPALFQMDSLFLAHASAVWPMVSVLVLGLARSIMGEFYFEDRLQLPVGSPRHLFITLSCSCLLELVFGRDISPLGFLVCSGLLFIGSREILSSASVFSWDSIVEREASDSFIKGPLRHIVTDRKSRKIALFLVMNAAFMVVEFISGFMSNSLGLVSDACHMLFDCAALAIGLYAAYISRLQPNVVFGYGYGRFEVLSGFANAVFLVLVASLIVLESIERILDPPEISTEKLLLVSVGGLLVNVVGLIFFHEEHHHAHHAHHHHHHGEDDKHGSHELSVHLLDGKNCQGGHEHSSESDGCMHHEHDHCQHEGKHGEQNHKFHRQGEHSDHHDDHQHNHSPHGHTEQHSHSHHDHSHSNHSDQHGHSDHEHCHSNHGHTEQHTHSHHGHSDHQQHNHDQSHSHSPSHHGRYDHQQHNHDQSHSHSEHQHDSHSHHGHSTHQGDSHSHHSHSDHAHSNHHDHHHDSDSHHHHHIDHNMRGIFLHVLADTLGSVGVVISTILIQYKGWLLTDPACSIFISAMIIASVIPLLKNSAEILLQRTPRAIEKRVHEALEKVRHVEGVAGFERLHVWSFTNSEIVGTLHLHASSVADKDQVRVKVDRLLNKLGITDITIQVEEI